MLVQVPHYPDRREVYDGEERHRAFDVRSDAGLASGDYTVARSPDLHFGRDLRCRLEGGHPLGEEDIAGPRARLEGTWDFSFSGLKTAVLRVVHQFEEKNQPLPVADLAASFQAAVVDVLVGKTVRAVQELEAAEILVAGGVSANRALRQTIQAQAPCPVHIPPIELCTDNAAMVAAAGFFRFRAGVRSQLNMDVSPDLELVES